MSPAPVVSAERVGDGVVRVRFEDPATRNGLTERLLDEMPALLRELGGDEGVRALVLTGARDVFCGGGTLEMVQAVAAGERLPRDAQLGEAIMSFPVPVVAALEGVAIGAGLAVALCADVLVAAESRRYGFNFTALGFTPGMGVTGLLPPLVGPQFASEMLYSARFYTGRELRGRGIFAHVVADGEVLDTALDLAQRFAERPRAVLTLLKSELSRGRVAALREALEREHEMHRACFAEPGVAEAIREHFPDWAAKEPAP